ncbi:MAG: c-type cytochrome [Verrucomicrobiota bacterium JB025]|nr:cytochrome c [Verrucomicrobiota bacterium JB025]
MRRRSIPILLLSLFAHAAVGETRTEILETGRKQFILCAACHGPQGMGTAAAPPLAGSEWVEGPAENLIRIQLRGLVGPITVNGQTYDIAGGMTPFASQSDEQIAAVLSYVRNSFGNSAPLVEPSQVAALRSEVGKPRLTEKDLIPVHSSPPAPSSTPSDKYDSLEEKPNRPLLIASVIAAVALISLIPVFRRKDP